MSIPSMSGWSFVLRCGVLALGVGWSCPAVAAGYTVDDVVQAVDRGFPAETIETMIESTEWELEPADVRRLLRAGVPPAYVEKMLGPDAPSLSELEALPDEVDPYEGLVGRFVVLRVADGVDVRGFLLESDAGKLRVALVSDAERRISANDVVSVEPATQGADDWGARLGRTTRVITSTGRTEVGRVVAVDPESLVVERPDGVALVLPWADVAGFAHGLGPEARPPEEPVVVDAATLDAELDAELDTGLEDGRPDGGPNIRDWEAVERSALTTGRVGLALAAVGASGHALGVIIGNEPIAIGSSLALVVGVPVAAGGATRAARAAREQGLDVSPAGGTIAWALFGASFAVGLVPLVDPAADPVAVAIASDGLVLGSIVSSALQMGAVVRESRLASGEGSRGDAHALAVSVSPTSIVVSGAF